jgi:hypothetical protein
MLLILGVPHLAVVHYERVLSLVKNRMDLEEHDDFKDVSTTSTQGDHGLMDRKSGGTRWR